MSALTHTFLLVADSNLDIVGLQAEFDNRMANPDEFPGEIVDACAHLTRDLSEANAMQAEADEDYDTPHSVFEIEIESEADPDDIEERLNESLFEGAPASLLIGKLVKLFKHGE